LQLASENCIDNLGQDDLRLPVLIHQLKKKHAGNPKVMKELQEATDLLFAGKCDVARGILEKLASRIIEKFGP